MTMKHERATIVESSPPPSGEGMGVGVAMRGDLTRVLAPPPSLALPQRKSGVPDVRTTMPNPGKPGFGGGENGLCPPPRLGLVQRNLA